MDKQEIEKLETMLKSPNIDDVNLAGNLIKNWLKLDDDKLKQLYKFIDVLHNQTGNYRISKFELMRQLFNSDVHQPDSIHYYQWQTTTQPYYTTAVQPYYTGNATITNSGILTTNTNEIQTT